MKHSGLLQKNADCSPEGHHPEGDKWRKGNKKVKEALKRGRTSGWLLWGSFIEDQAFALSPKMETNGSVWGEGVMRRGELSLEGGGECC